MVIIGYTFGSDYYLPPAKVAVNDSVVTRAVMYASQGMFILVIVGLCSLAFNSVEKKLNERFMISSEFPSTSTLSRGIPDTYFEEKLTSGFAEQSISAALDKAPQLDCTLQDIGGQYNFTDRQCSSDSETTSETSAASSITSRSEQGKDERFAASMITSCLKDRNVEAEAKDTHEMTIKEYTRIRLPGVSSTIMPDVSITNKKDEKLKGVEDNYIVFIEVLSETLKKTIKKLYYVLVLQLIYIRSFSKGTVEVSGFVLPKREAKGKIVLATVRWEETLHQFIGSLTVILKGKFLDRLCEVIENQKHFDGIPPQVIYFSNSLSPQGLSVYLNNRAFEQAVFELALSVVFRLDNKVYKMPLDYRSINTLYTFYLKSSSKPKQVLLPEKVLQGNNLNFFVFRYLHPPLDIKSIQSCFDAFAKSVQSAVEELHDMGFVHLDLRVPNICFERINGQWEAVLIDLDRCCSIDHKPPSSVQNNNSVMYNVTFDNSKQYDWRQFAIMLARVVQDNHADYHTAEPEFKDDALGKVLKHCFSNGEKPHSELKWEGQTQKTLNDVLKAS